MRRLVAQPVDEPTIGDRDSGVRRQRLEKPHVVVGECGHLAETVGDLQAADDADVTAQRDEQAVLRPWSASHRRSVGSFTVRGTRMDLPRRNTRVKEYYSHGRIEGASFTPLSVAAQDIHAATAAADVVYDSAAYVNLDESGKAVHRFPASQHHRLFSLVETSGRWLVASIIDLDQ